jgi:GNAT superfamily N-acetyltransferase
VKGGRRLWTTDGKLPGVTVYREHARNAAAMWEALSKGYGALLVGTEEVRIVKPSPYHALRAIVLDPQENRDRTVRSIVDTVVADGGRGLRVVEDPSGEMELSGYGLTAEFRMTVMTRPPVPVPDRAAMPDGIRVVPVTDPEGLAAAERILIAVFPPPLVPGDPRGRIQPSRVLSIPGWRVWLGYRDGVPAGAAYTYHDGTTVGLYKLATLPEHRGWGVGRAVLTALLRAYPRNSVNLTATDQGRPLYDSVDFEAVSEAVWWRPSHTGDDSGHGLR